jgi:hypothetical protein
MRAATRWGASFKACSSVVVVTGWTPIKDCTTASFRYRTLTHLTPQRPSSCTYRVPNNLVVMQITPYPTPRIGAVPRLTDEPHAGASFVQNSPYPCFTNLRLKPARAWVVRMWLPSKARLPALSQMFYKTRGENSLSVPTTDI